MITFWCTNMSSFVHIECTECSDAREIGLYPIHDAVIKGDWDKILSLLKEGHDINSVDECDKTPVILAIELNKDDILNRLLNEGADLYLGDTNPLQIAISSNPYDLATMEVLLENGLNPSDQNWSLWTPLHHACYMHLESVLERFLSVCHDFNVENENGATPVYIACEEGHRDCLEMLLEVHADAESPANNGFTPLHIASKNGYTACVASLLNRGKVHVDGISNISHTTPLILACLNHHYECSKLLLQKNASLYPKNLDGDCSAIHIAARSCSTSFLALLIEKGADVNGRNKAGSTSLHQAVEGGNLPACVMLLENGADPNCQCPNDNGLDQTPLMLCALRDGFVKYIEVLVAHGANINFATFTSPLILAAENKSFKEFEHLLSYDDIDVNYVDQRGHSALSALCKLLVLLRDFTSTFDKVLQCTRDILISHGANISHVIQRIQERSYIVEKILSLSDCPELIKLLLEFATCQEHMISLSTICKLFSDNEKWQQVCNFVTRPRPLIHLCRIKIRCLLGAKRLRKIEELPVPVQLKGYLLHTEEMSFD